ncbi:hypothetical protein D1872_50910 [compost metagenome]
MSAGRFHHSALTTAYNREHLVERGRANGVDWQEHGHEGINWMRFSTALHKHLDDGNEFHMDNDNPETLKQMLGHYTALRETHKQTMVPHIRAAMAKLHADHGDGTMSHMDFLDQAYEHLEANGGHHWAEKVSVLSSLNKHINRLTDRLTKMGHQV